MPYYVFDSITDAIDKGLRYVGVGVENVDSPIFVIIISEPTHPINAQRERIGCMKGLNDSFNRTQRRHTAVLLTIRQVRNTGFHSRPS